MPSWTEHYNALMDRIENEAVSNSQEFKCRFPVPHFYPGLAEEELTAMGNSRLVLSDQKSSLFATDATVITVMHANQAQPTTVPTEVKERAIRFATYYNDKERKRRTACEHHLKVLGCTDRKIYCSKCGASMDDAKTQEDMHRWR